MLRHDRGFCNWYAHPETQTCVEYAQTCVKYEVKHSRRNEHDKYGLQTPFHLYVDRVDALPYVISNWLTKKFV